MSSELLVRYGAISEVARFRCDLDPLPQRGAPVVVHTDRGLELGTTLDQLRPQATTGPAPPAETQSAPGQPWHILRPATDSDLARHDATRIDIEAEFTAWNERIADWELDLALVDLEWTLDREKLILYVLNERGPESTKLAIQAAAAGLASVHVQPVDAEGIVQVAPSTGGCGTGGCGCHTPAHTNGTQHTEITHD